MPISFMACDGCFVGNHDEHKEPARGWRAIFTSNICRCEGECVDRFARFVAGVPVDSTEEEG